jgi:hypothetical protein
MPHPAPTVTSMLAALFCVAAAACSGGGGGDIGAGGNEETATATPEPAQGNGFTGATTDFIRVVTNIDVQGFRAIATPDWESATDERIAEILGATADLDGCDGSTADYRMTDTFGVQVDVTAVFRPLCGEFGVTESCTLTFKRAEGDWKVMSWRCDLNTPDATPVT